METNREDKTVRFTSMGGALINLTQISAKNFDALYTGLQTRLSTEPTWAKFLIEQELGVLDDHIAGFSRE